MGDYGPGYHTWPYWRRELADEPAALMRAFQRATPAGADLLAPRDRALLSDMGLARGDQRPALEFSELRRAGRKGFALRGSGTATVTTARLFRAGARVRVQLRSAGASAVASSWPIAPGRLTVRVRLGRGNPRQQYTAGSKTAVFTTRVGFHPR